jgi:hypothetical protein
LIEVLQTQLKIDVMKYFPEWGWFSEDIKGVGSFSSQTIESTHRFMWDNYD